jgi:hypothetical protein
MEGWPSTEKERECSFAFVLDLGVEGCDLFELLHVSALLGGLLGLGAVFVALLSDYIQLLLL